MTDCKNNGSDIITPFSRNERPKSL